MQRSTKGHRVSLASKKPNQPGATVIMYRCRMSLEDLRDTDHPEVKFCDNCSRSVFRARDAEGLLQLVASDSCVWIDDGGPEVEIGLVVNEK